MGRSSQTGAKLHDGSGAGQGLEPLTKDVAEQLSSDDFWAFVERLATGRRLVITSDHGYAATGYFPDADGEVGQFLKQTFGSSRSKAGTGAQSKKPRVVRGSERRHCQASNYGQDFEVAACIGVWVEIQG
jgi:hypothetical protein